MGITTAGELLSIGAFASRSRLSVRALRLYAELGLLAPARVDPDSGYRYYSPDQVDRARLIGLLRRLDMPLARIGLVLEADGDVAAREVAAFWAEVEASVAVKRRLVAYLERHLEARGQAMYEVQTRDVAARDVISVTRSLTVKELEPFIINSCAELQAQLERSSAKRDGPWLVIYHGQVDEDSDGPVEVAVPFRGQVEPLGGTAQRSEPAHREAYTTITRAQTHFPEILDAYAAVEQWIENGGKQIAGSPREVYFNDDPEPQRDQPFCDVAFPFR